MMAGGALLKSVTMQGEMQHYGKSHRMQWNSLHLAVGNVRQGATNELQHPI